MFKKLLIASLLTVSSLTFATSISTRAADDEIATGLNNPRLLTYDSSGALYIAEAGSGGDTDAEGPIGKVQYGTTAQVSMVDPAGKQSVIVDDLISTSAGFGQINGASKVLVTEDSYWIALGLGPKVVPDGSHVAAVVQLDRKTGEAKEVIDLQAFEVANNPDGDQEPVSNPVDIALAADDTLYIVDASANAVLSWTKADGLKVALVWAVDKQGQIPQAVPTSVAIGKDGRIFVGFLGGFPFVPGSTRIEVWENGKLIDTYNNNNLTLVTDIEIADDGTLYAVQMASGFGDQGYIPDSGSIVALTDEGIMPVVQNLNFPYGLALAADGSFAVTVDSAFVEPDKGRVIKVAPAK